MIHVLFIFLCFTVCLHGMEPDESSGNYLSLKALALKKLLNDSIREEAEELYGLEVEIPVDYPRNWQQDILKRHEAPKHQFRDFKQVISAVKFSPNGQRLLAASHDNTVCIWDVRSGQELAKLEGHRDAVRRVRYSSNGQCILTMSYDTTARLWDEDGRMTGILEGHTDTVTCGKFDEQGMQVVTGSQDQTVAIWDPRVDSMIRRFAPHKGAIKRVTFLPGHRIAATSRGDDDDYALVWDIRMGRLLYVIDATDKIICNPEGTLLLSSSDARHVRIHDASTGSVTKAYLFNFCDIISQMYWREQKPMLVMARLDPGLVDYGTVSLWDIESGQKTHTFKGHSGIIESARLSADGTLLITCADDHTVRIWDVATHNQIVKFKTGPVSLAKCNREVTDLVTSTGFQVDDIHSLDLWDIADVRELSETDRYMKDDKRTVKEIFALAAHARMLDMQKETRSLAHSAILSTMPLAVKRLFKISIFTPAEQAAAAAGTAASEKEEEK